MLLLAAIGAAISVALTVFWATIKAFVLAAAEKIKQVLMGAAAEAVSLFVRKGVDGLKSLAYNYINQGGRYIEKIVTKKIEESEMPNDIRQRAESHYGNEVDITSDFASALQL